MAAECLFSVLFAGAFVLLFFLMFAKKFLPKATVGEYHKRYVLITGCDSGFGKETAIRLDQMGFHVFATCLTPAGEESLKAACSDNLQVYHLDVTRHEEVQHVFEEIKRSLPRNTGLWGTVNNAGILIPGLIDWQPLENFKLHADVNLWGLIDVTKTFLPLVKQARGRVVNFSSAMGRLTFAHLSAYCITKYGVQAFSDALRREMAPWGIHVSIIEPGGFRTSMTKGPVIASKYQQLWESLDSDVKEEYGEEFIHKLSKSFQAVSKKIPIDFTPVSDAVIDSLTAQSPRTRYRVGLDSKLFSAIALLPTTLEDLLAKRLRVAPIPKSKKSGPDFVR